MKLQSILVAFDGSASAESAIDDLRRAGLPKQCDATIVSVAETEEVGYDGLEESNGHDAAATVALIAPRTRRAGVEVQRAQRLAEAGAARLHSAQREWLIHRMVLAGDPAEEILRLLDAQRFDLVVLGSHGRGIVGRALLGSVSQRVLARSPVSVRIGRDFHPFDNEAVRVVLGYDGSPDARLAVRSIGARSWPRGSSVRVVGAVAAAAYPTNVAAFDIAMTEAVEQEAVRLRAGVSRVVRRLRSGGMIATGEIDNGSPASVILDAARTWGADLVVVGARGHGAVERLLLGSVSAALAARAECSVEVLRHTER